METVGHIYENQVRTSPASIKSRRTKRIILEQVIPRFRKMGFPAKPYKFFAKHDHVYKWRAQVYSKSLHLELKRIIPHIVSYFQRLSDNDAKLFVAGFTDAEGTVAMDSIRIYNQNVRLLRAIRVRLTKFGIAPTYIYRYDNVMGLVIMRKECVRRLVHEVHATKFDMYRNNSIISRALKLNQ